MNSVGQVASVEGMDWQCLGLGPFFRLMEWWEVDVDPIQTERREHVGDLNKYFDFKTMQKSSGGQQV